MKSTYFYTISNRFIRSVKKKTGKGFHLIPNFGVSGAFATSNE